MKRLLPILFVIVFASIDPNVAAHPAIRQVNFRHITFPGIFESLRFTFTFLRGCGLTASPKSLPIPVQQQVAPARDGDRVTEAFITRIEKRRPKRTSSNISIKPITNKIRARVLSLANGKTLVLSIPVEITNSSSRSIRMNLSHEWYGGIWPPTDLYVAVRLSGAEKTTWEDAPGYQVGEKDSVSGKTKLAPGQTKTFDIRLNWPGTGSIPTMPLVDESRPGKYSIKFMLFFHLGGSQEYVESQAVDIELLK